MAIQPSGFITPLAACPIAWSPNMKWAGVRFFWSTETDPPRLIDDIREITDAHIRAIEPPRDEEGWLDPTGWMGVYAARTIATELQVV